MNDLPFQKLGRCFEATISAVVAWALRGGNSGVSLSSSRAGAPRYGVVWRVDAHYSSTLTLRADRQSTGRQHLKGN